MADMEATVRIEEMIKKEINRIGDLQERVVFKDMVENVFLSLYEANGQMYRELESRIMDDLAFDINRYRVCTGIVEREYLDRSHHLLSPMREEDTRERVYDMAEIRKRIRKDGCCPVKTFFMEYDYLGIEKLLAEGKAMGLVVTSGGEYPVEFAIKRNGEYLGEVSHLYKVFIGNGIPWQTVNMPYLYKFVDLFLTGIPEGITEADTVLRIEPDLGEYAPWAHENYLPVWNIKKVEMDSVGFPVPCEDHKGYEHTISVKEYGNDHVYLVDDGAAIHHVRQRENHLIVMGEDAEARKWQVYMIRAGTNRRIDRFTYPLMTNLRKDEFLERFACRQGMRVRTKAELARLIRGYGLEEYVEYVDCGILDGERGEVPVETYSMNPFLLDEVREGGYRKRLVLKFIPKGEPDFLLRDIMSFLVSEVQLLYGEYLCEGRLV